MLIPKYVQELMGRSYFDLSYTHPEADPGYTLKIKKATPYTRAETLKDECERLVKWANRVGQSFPDIPTAKLLCYPKETHYVDQAATVVIYDPVMRQLEKYIPTVEKRRE